MRSKQDIQKKLEELMLEKKNAEDKWWQAFCRNSSAYCSYAAYDNFLNTKPITIVELGAAADRRNQVEKLIRETESELNKIERDQK